MQHHFHKISVLSFKREKEYEYDSHWNCRGSNSLSKTAMLNFIQRLSETLYYIEVLISN